MRIYLIGFMGCGKTHIGQQLAGRLGLPFRDLDEMIESRAGMPAARIFQEQGEAHFRKMEADCLRETSYLKRAVVATGGGTPCFHGNLEWMFEHGVTLYIKVSAGLLAAWLEAEVEKRPLLEHKKGAALAGLVDRLLAVRSAFYEKAQLCYERKTGEEDPVPELANYLSRFVSAA